MALTKSAARKLTTQAEWALLETSFPPLLKDITSGRLKQRISRTRKLQDKYRDLAEQQRGEARGKRRPKSTRPATGNENTVAKQELFGQALDRFEGQMEKLDAKVARESARKEKAAEKAAATLAKSAARKAGTAAKRAAAQGTATSRKAVSKAARGARKAAVFTRTASTKHQAHTGARGRRNQARRDSK